MMDDQKDKQIISLHTHGEHNILRFNADLVDPYVMLVTHKGSISHYAKKTHKMESGDDFTERTGDNRMNIAENKHSTTTGKAIHHQAKTHINDTAHNNIKTKSGENTELHAGNNLNYTITESATFDVKGSDGFFARVKNGELIINAAKDISITGKGGGDITFENNGGGFKIKDDGTINLYGSTVQLGGQGQVSLIGDVNYTIGGGTIPPAVSITPPLIIQTIAKILDGDPDISTQDIKIKINDEYLNQLGGHLTLNEQIYYRLTSDTGEQRIGELQEGFVIEQQVEMKKDITLEFSEGVILEE